MYRILLLLMTLCALSLAAQPQSAEELKFKESSVNDPYQPAGEHAFVRSKLGYEGVNPTDEANAAVGRPVKEIALVFTEMETDGERKTKNIERWDNLLFTYPEFFQKTTIYKNICQCNPQGDESAFKAVQGFYIYFADEKTSVPKAAVTAPAEEKKEIARKEVGGEEVTKQEEIKKEEPQKIAEPEVRKAVAAEPEKSGENVSARTEMPPGTAMSAA